MITKRILILLSLALSTFILCPSSLASATPNIVLVMTDDQGWGQMGYQDHPVLKTPHLAAMAANGLRFERFYAGAPNCSPTRSTVMTGRSNNRTGVEDHGFPLRLQEKPLPKAMQNAGYTTGHFGKWHLNGFRGPGTPILGSDPRSPGAFGFDEWLSVSNFFDRNPIMSRQGTFEEFEGDSSEIIVAEALEFITRQAKSGKPSFTVIWYGTPHSPFVASDEDKAPFPNLEDPSKNHYGEMVAMDRSIGTLRRGLRNLRIADNTLVWFNSDNGGLQNIKPDTVGGLRGNKGTVFEGGLRVPCVIEWPAVIKNSRITSHPTATMDIFPTIAEIVGLPKSDLLQPQDGMSVRALFDNEIGPRKKPLGFRHMKKAAFLDNDYKLVAPDMAKGEFYLYNVAKDPNETNDLYRAKPAIAKRMLNQFQKWDASVQASYEGKDYPEGHVDPDHPGRRDWTQSEEYEPYFEAWKNRPEFKRYLNN
ncbi:MAG: sulfatase-like hydrolase/transferase [Opitutaceae bacterium]|nr:sulfatase-like hydrolase/transferase [Opitutaceae bacterium]